MSAAPAVLDEGLCRMPSGAEGKRRHPHVITITSGKGGVGKTNITANLAYQLRRLGRRVLVLDGDLGLANLDILFGLTPQYNIAHVLAGEKRLSEIVMQGPAGIEFLPGGSRDAERFEITEPQMLLLMEQIEELGADADYLLIDTGAGVSPNVAYFALAAQTTMVVATPEPTSLSDAYGLIKVLATAYRQTHFALLVNEAASEREALDVYRQLTTASDKFLNVSMDYLGFLPRDPRVREAVQSRKTFMELFPNSVVAQALERVAAAVTALENDPMRSDLGLLWRSMIDSPAA